MLQQKVLNLNPFNESTKRAWVEINLTNLKNNLNEVKSILPDKCKVMAVVKANAYGHGAVAISEELYRNGIRNFAVASIDEGIELRKNAIKGEILILGYTPFNEIKNLVKYNLTQTIIDKNYALMLNTNGIKINVHIKIDTGMNRLGERVDNFQDIKKIYTLKNLKVQGTYTHLCVAGGKDKSDVDFTRNQINRFYAVIKKLNDSGIDPKKIHIQNSYGVLNYPNLKCDYARVGIYLYGVLTRKGDYVKQKINLKPILSMKARIVLIKNLNKGDSIGYGRTPNFENKRKIASVSVGFADGIPRNLAQNLGYVLIKGQRAKIIDNICMDQLFIDVTDIKDVKSGDFVTIIGNDKLENISSEMFADICDTITTDIFCKISNRVDRIYKVNGEVL